MDTASTVQRVIKVFGWTALGAIALGSLLDAVSNAIAIVTPQLTDVGTAIVGSMWLLGQVWMVTTQPRWRSRSGSHVVLRSFGTGTTAAFIGAIILLWIPRLQDAYVREQLSRESRRPPRSGAEAVSAEKEPTLSVEVIPAQILPGETAQLSWASTGAADVLILPDIGPAEARGVRAVAPSYSTTYIVAAATRTGAVSIREAALHVRDRRGAELKIPWLPVAGTVTVSADSKTDTPPILSWNSFNATSVGIVPTVGLVTGAGQLEVYPKSTTTFTVIMTNASGAWGRSQAKAHVYQWPNGSR